MNARQGLVEADANAMCLSRKRRGRVMPKLRALLAAAIFAWQVGVGGARPAMAYCVFPPEASWVYPPPYDMVMGPEYINSGAGAGQWYTWLLASARKWLNIQGSTFDLQFYGVGQYPFGFGNGDSNLYYGDYTLFGVTWDIPGRVFYYNAAGALVNPMSSFVPFSRANLVINGTVTWKQGTMVKDEAQQLVIADPETVAVHEFGHVARMGHPDWAGYSAPYCPDDGLTGPEESSVMYPQFEEIRRTPTAHDIAAMQYQW